MPTTPTDRTLDLLALLRLRNALRTHLANPGDPVREVTLREAARVLEVAIPFENVHFFDGTGDWAAVYVDGELASGPGDRENRYEYLLELFGVNYEQTDDFLLGTHKESSRNTRCAKTTAEIWEYQRRVNEAEAAAQELERQAKELRDRARQTRTEAGIRR